MNRFSPNSPEPIPSLVVTRKNYEPYCLKLPENMAGQMETMLAAVGAPIPNGLLAKLASEVRGGAYASNPEKLAADYSCLRTNFTVARTINITFCKQTVEEDRRVCISKLDATEDDPDGDGFLEFTFRSHAGHPGLKDLEIRIAFDDRPLNSTYFNSAPQVIFYIGWADEDSKTIPEVCDQRWELLENFIGIAGSAEIPFNLSDWIVDTAEEEGEAETIRNHYDCLDLKINGFNFVIGRIVQKESTTYGLDTETGLTRVIIASNDLTESTNGDLAFRQEGSGATDTDNILIPEDEEQPDRNDDLSLENPTAKQLSEICRLIGFPLSFNSCNAMLAYLKSGAKIPEFVLEELKGRGLETEFDLGDGLRNEDGDTEVFRWLEIWDSSLEGGTHDFYLGVRDLESKEVELILTPSVMASEMKAEEWKRLLKVMKR